MLRTSVAGAKRQDHLRVALPTLPEKGAAGPVIKVAGLTGRIRGMEVPVGRRPKRPAQLGAD